VRVLASSHADGLACAPAPGDGPLVVFGDQEVGEPVAVRWLAGPGGAGQIAPAGHALWRRAPWPASDALFELPPPPPGAPVLLAGGEAGRRGELEYALGAAGLPLVASERLTRAALEQASAVLLLPAPGAEGAVPAEAPAVLAARRLLVTPTAEVGFGLLPGIDHLQFTLFNEATHLLVEARKHPAALEPMRVWGAAAARRHRATEVLARLEADLALRNA
jgi:hypothetical protein